MRSCSKGFNADPESPSAQQGKRDYDKAFPLFLVAGKHGHAAGSYRAAQCLENGWGTRKDWSKAVSFYRSVRNLHRPLAWEEGNLTSVPILPM